MQISKLELSISTQDQMHGTISDLYAAIRQLEAFPSKGFLARDVSLWKAATVSLLSTIYRPRCKPANIISNIDFWETTLTISPTGNIPPTNLGFGGPGSLADAALARNMPPLGFLPPKPCDPLTPSAGQPTAREQKFINAQARAYDVLTAAIGDLNYRLVSQDVNDNRTVFIVHGHDTGLLNEVDVFLLKLGFNTTVLGSEPNQMRTVIEKFEKHASQVGFAVILMTPDDIGYAVNAGRDSQQYRSRQNVVLELGFFLDKFGRSRMCLIQRGNIEVPSDLGGVIYTATGEANWKEGLRTELRAAGYTNV